MKGPYTPMPPIEYPKPERLAHETEAQKILEKLGSLADQAGIDVPAIERGLELLTRTGRFTDELAARRETTSDTSKRIAQALVLGELDVDSAALEVARSEALRPDSVLARAIRRTPQLAAREAIAIFRRELDGDQVLEQARQCVADTLDAIRALRKPLKGIRDAEQATAAGHKVASAWATYQTELLPRWDAAHELVKTLRSYHWLKPLPIGAGVAFRWGRYDLAREDIIAARRADETILLLLDEICDAWLPGGPHTEQEALEFTRAVEERHREEHSRTRALRERLQQRVPTA